MDHYLIDIDLPEEPDDEYISLIPEQRAQINQLMQDGIVTSYSLSVDRSKLWATVVAENEREVGQILTTFPLIRYMVYSIHKLAFHNTAQYTMPPISLN
ncbi:MAG: hypothetical protein H7259_05885 [Cytophagales bacterium]|nr:hypothetical protein [Cytophaga sp.]